MKLNKKRYWLIGASEGLGREMARQLSAMGVELVISARTKSRLDDLALELPNKTTVLPIDVQNIKNITKSVQKLGEIDGVIYAAGIYTPMAAGDWKLKTVESMCDINFTGATRILGSVVPDFVRKNEGHIVIIGSLSGFRGLPESIGYSSSKAALMHLAECLHADLHRTNVKVQLLNPGFIKTRLTDQNDFKMPFIMSVEKAATHAIKAMQKSGFQYNFPRFFSWVFRGANFLPAAIYYRLFGQP